MPAGELRGKIGFYNRVPIDTDYGTAAGDWVLQFTRSSRIRYLRGGEEVMGQRLEGVSPIVLTVRSGEETRQITSGWQARNERTGEQFQIRAVTPDEKTAWIDLLCESGVAQ
jgi:head-tail adaptor